MADFIGNETSEQRALRRQRNAAEDAARERATQTTPINDGGPAFPVDTHSSEGHQSGPNTWQYPGMTLRDYFAGEALKTLVGGTAAEDVCDKDPRYDGTNFATVVALNAYEFADAMLAVRAVRS